ncbi:MAG: hypothetical protein II588_04300 [Paludibacteraceae bacterium]|nr:hypothetical protein [Paludibacteraceae bacterium]
MSKGERLMAKGERMFGLMVLSIFIFQFSIPSCRPLPVFETDDVEISSDIRVLSSGFVEHHFSTSRDAYYLIGIEPARAGYDPTAPENQKQFMTLELDSANLVYLDWRRKLLQQGVFSIASFASHSLQYGETDYFFTGLKPSTDYWVYAFVVDPDKLQPKGRLHLQKITTTDQSTVDVHFEYRLRSDWDYIYPLDSTGKHIRANFPYVHALVDSMDIRQSGKTPQEFFADSLTYLLNHPQEADVQYGVYARNLLIEIVDRIVEKEQTLDFDYERTYYTAIAGFDGVICHPAIYRFHFTREANLYFYDTDSTNLVKSGGW